MMHVFLKFIFESWVGLEAWQMNTYVIEAIAKFIEQIYLMSIFSKEQKLSIYIFCFL